MKHTLFCLIVGLLLLSCNKNENIECPTDIICTQVIVSIGVTIKNNNNEFIKLSKTQTEIEGIAIEVGQNDFDPIYGTYTILDDGALKSVKKSGSKVTFKGFDANNQLVVYEQYRIGHDCCHVIKISGKDEVIVD